MTIESIAPAHYPAIAEIYLEGIATGHATFETQAPDWEKWDASHLPTCRFAAFEAGKMLGWAALTAVSGRCVYAGVAEVSVYISADSRGKGVGKVLMEKLVEASELQGIWTLQAGIFPENTASIRLHEQFGFRMIGYRERIGKMGDIWRNTVLMERRSQAVGV